jgi:exonuclease VII large subunit
MSPVVAEILQQIDQLSLLEQTNILRQLEQKIETTTNLNTSPTPINSSQQQWQQAVDQIHNQTPNSLDLQKTRISDLFAKFNADEDEEDQQQALDIINSIPRTAI